jgi:hypothetical protein
MDRACRTIGEKRNVYGLLMGMPDVRGWIILGWAL